MNNQSDLKGVDKEVAVGEPKPVIEGQPVKPLIKLQAPEHDSASISRAIDRKARALFEKGDFTGAKELFEQVIKRSEASPRGPDDPDLAYLFTTLGFTYRRLADKANAHIYFERAFKIRLEGLGALDLLTIDSQDILATSFYSQDNVDQSKLLYRRSIAQLNRILEEQSPNRSKTLIALGNSLSGLGFVHKWTGDTKGAFKLFAKALRVRKEALKPDDLDLAESYKNVADCLLATKRVLARPFHQHALAIREDVLGPNDSDVAESLYDLGCAWVANLDVAGPLFERSLAIREEVLLPNDFDLTQPLEGVAYIRWKQGNIDAANRHLQRALSIIKADPVLGESSSLYKQFLALLRNVNQSESAIDKPIHILNLRPFIKIDNLRVANGRFLHSNKAISYSYSSDIDDVIPLEANDPLGEMEESIKDAILYAKSDSEKEAILSAIFNDALAREGFSVTVTKIDSSSLSLPEQAPRLWKDRTLGQNPQEFIASVYERWLGNGLTMQHIKQLDAPLYNAYAVYRHRHPDEDPPFDLPNKKAIVSREVEDLNPEKIKEFRRLLSASQRRREP